MIDRRNFLLGSAALAAACAETPVVGNNAQAERAPSSPDFAPVLAGLGTDVDVSVM